MKGARPYRRFFVAAYALLAMLASTLGPVRAAEEPCRGTNDGQDLATLSVRVVAAKREAFLTAVRAYGSGRSMGVGGWTDNKGWVAVILESRPYGVSIEVEAMDENNFRAIARTCNATENWRPYWDEFKQFIESSRAQWS